MRWSPRTRGDGLLRASRPTTRRQSSAYSESRCCSQTASVTARIWSTYGRMGVGTFGALTFGLSTGTQVGTIVVLSPGNVETCLIWADSIACVPANEDVSYRGLGSGKPRLT